MRNEIEIDFTSQQLELLDRLAAVWALPRDSAVVRILDEAIAEGSVLEREEAGQ